MICETLIFPVHTFSKGLSAAKIKQNSEKKMEKGEKYIKPQIQTIQTIYMAPQNIVCASLTIGSDSDDELDSDEDGYFWAE